MEIKLTCPLGSDCETILDNRMHRCRWYIALRGKNPMGEDVIDRWGCAMEWLPVLLVENAQTNRGQTQAIESFRNEMVDGQNTFNALIATAINARVKKALAPD